MTRRERRVHLQEQYKQNLSQGYGQGMPNAIKAGGQTPSVNPFMIPKTVGLGVTTKMWPSYYMVEWNPTTWRQACDQAINHGWPIAYATLTSWAFECSTFIQGLFQQIGVGIEGVPFFLTDSRGNKYEELTKEICEKPWFVQLKKEILFAKLWGFTVINFDPIRGKVYKYPMQQIDPINRAIRKGTFEIFQVTPVDEMNDLIFVQPSTNYEAFLGWMQPITRDFININVNMINQIAAGKRFAFPMLTVGYPQNSNALDEDGSSYNQHKAEAEAIVQNADVTNGVVYPYTLDAQGNIQKAIDIQLTSGTQGTKGSHAIYSDYNETQKSDIRELVLGGNLTSTTQKNGNRSLGDIHMQKLEQVKASNIEYVLSEMNDDFIKKLSTFYKNFPKDARFSVNKSKQWDIDQIVQISTVVNQNNIKLSRQFFEDNGLNPEYMEEIEEVEEEKKDMSLKKKLS